MYIYSYTTSIVVIIHDNVFLSTAFFKKLKTRHRAVKLAALTTLTAANMAHLNHSNMTILRNTILARDSYRQNSGSRAAGHGGVARAMGANNLDATTGDIQLNLDSRVLTSTTVPMSKSQRIQ